MPRATKEPAEKFGIALVAWVVGCAALAYEAKSFRSVVATRALALALAVLGTSEARAHVTRLRCGTLQSIGMWTQTERDLRARNDCGHVTGKLAGPVDVRRES